MKQLLKNESGAVTVDWIVLCAVMVLLGFMVVATAGTGLRSAASGVETQISDAVQNPE
ncbi:MAG: hypothetical protein AAFR98_01620 [Pseudomonadota bacterium]